MNAVKGLFSFTPEIRAFHIPDSAYESAFRGRELMSPAKTIVPQVDERMSAVYARALNPDDPIELRNLWLGRVEHELGKYSFRPELAQLWRDSCVHRHVSVDEILASRATVRFVKELFNWFFRDDLYGMLRSDRHLILSSGSVDEEAWGLPETLKACIRYALDRDWYGYSDSRGRDAARGAIAAYESERIDGAMYRAENVAITMGGTFAVSALADLILMGNRSTAPSLCAIPNYPPLVESIARRGSIRLIPLPAYDGQMCLEPLIAAVSPDTPLILLQTVANPTGAVISDEQLTRLIEVTSPTTMVILDECHEWLGPFEKCRSVRAASNVIRVFSVSKGWAAPGLKTGWITADADFIGEYYEYASTSFGGPPSFFYTFVEVLARMERWLITGIKDISRAEVEEFEHSYNLTQTTLAAAYRSYREERTAREEALRTLRDATMFSLSEVSSSVIAPRYSINMAVEFHEWDDSYRCFRDLLREADVAVFPGILTFCFSGGVVRITTARQWVELSSAISRVGSRSVKRQG